MAEILVARERHRLLPEQVEGTVSDVAAMKLDRLVFIDGALLDGKVDQREKRSELVGSRVAASVDECEDSSANATVSSGRCIAAPVIAIGNGLESCQVPSLKSRTALALYRRRPSSSS